MNDVTSHEGAKGCCSSEDAGTICCPPADGGVSSCCSPKEVSWNKDKALVSLVIIVAAIAVGAYSFVRGTSAESANTGTATSFSAKLADMPTVAAESRYQGKPQTKQEAIPLDRVVDSLQALDTMAADKDVVFVVLPGVARNPPLTIPPQVGTVATHLWNSGQRVGVFTLKSGAPDHTQLVRHFSINAFPCVVIFGRQGSASAVSGDITEARLFYAFLQASKPVACCPGQSNAACCPK